MTTKTALVALLAMWGVGSTTCIPAFADDSATREVSDSSPAKRSFTNRVWVKQGAGDEAPPGIMRIFLSDGTLVQDSCWETHRLSEWKMASDSAVSWNEDGVDVTADILSVSANDLVLSLKLGSDIIEERYVAADVPFVCPDMPKDA